MSPLDSGFRRNDGAVVVSGDERGGYLGHVSTGNDRAFSILTGRVGGFVY